MRYTLVLFFLNIIFVTAAQNANTEKGRQPKYYGKEDFLIEGTTFTDSVKEYPYDRLPASYKNKVRSSVWDLSKNSAGISIRFQTNSSSVSVKWDLLNDTQMNHMAYTGIKGVDLYCMIDNQWQFVNTGRPEKKENESLLVSNMPVIMREYKLYFPVYEGVTKVEIGIDSLSEIIKPDKNNRKPIVFYGTSITQGGCASRPGMVYTNIISRKLNVDCINFGFSGNGRMEKPLAELISGIDASYYVIDGTGNMTAEEVHKNARPLVEIIRSKRPTTPIVFVEGPVSETAYFDSKDMTDINDKNRTLKMEYEKMIKNGFQYIYYIDNKGMKGNDHESTVDGVHFTDLGFLRYADFFLTKLKQFKLTDEISINR